MTDEDVQIEFSDDELSPDYDPTQNISGGSEDGEESKQEPGAQDGVQENQPGNTDTEGAPAAPNPTDTQEGVVVAKTDADLAAEFGIDESDIKYAKNMGWSPKENFKGNPSDWKDPKAFIDIAEQSAPVLRDRLREMSKKVTEMQKAFPTILEMQKHELQNRVDGLAAENEQLQKDLEEAHLLANSKKAVEIANKIYENKIKMAITEEEQKHVGEGKSIAPADKTVVPDGIDVEREKAWRDSIYPKLTLEQREIYKEAVDFVTSPINADQTTDQRIAYIESKIFGRRAVPTAAPVARPSVADVAGAQPARRNEYEAWDSLSKEEKDTAVSIIAETDWYKNRDKDEKSKAMWHEFKKSFRK